MKRAKAIVIASLLSGISFVFSEVSVPFVSATEEISEMVEAEESELLYEDTAESELHSESSITEQKENQNRHEDISQMESELESSQEESGTQGEFEISAQETTEETETTLEDSESDMEESIEEMTDIADESDTEESTEEMTDIADESDTEEMTDVADKSGQIEKRWKVGTGLTSLRMPQKFAIVMDPWEMNGRKQVYSEQYIIKNTGDMSGTLKLTGIACEVGEDVHVQEKSDNIHSGKDKKVYIELLINDEDRIVLMPEGTDYEIELVPDACMTLEFTGAMNENSSENWQDSDVKISVTYDWRVEPQEIESEDTESISEIEEEGSERTSMTEEDSSEAESETEGTEVEPEPESEGTESTPKTEKESSETKSEMVGENIDIVSEPENESSEGVLVSEETASEAETTTTENTAAEISARNSQW